MDAAIRRMSIAGVLRHGWMDLLTACAFPALWLLRDHIDYDTLRNFLFWPVVFELFVAFALFLAGFLDSLRSTLLRSTWFAAVGAGLMFGAWLTGEAAGMPHAWTIAAWLLLARVWPPARMRLGSAVHRQWIWKGAGYSCLLWGAGFVATVLLMLVASGPAVADASGELSTTSPAWILPVVWTPYFLAEAVLRAWRQAAIAVGAVRARP